MPDWQIAKLVPEILYNAKKFPQFSGLSKKVVDLVTANPGRLTVSNIRGKAGKSGPLQASEREVRNTLDTPIDPACTNFCQSAAVLKFSGKITTKNWVNCCFSNKVSVTFGR